MRHQERNFCGPRIHTPVRKSTLDLLKETSQHCSHAAAHYDDVGIEQVDNVPQPNRQQVDRLLKDFSCHRVARVERLAYVLAGDRTDVSYCQIENCLSPQRFRGDFCSRPCADRRARRKDLDAAALATSADRASVVDAHVTAFARRAGLSVIDGAIEDDAGSDPGTDRCVEDVTEAVSSSPKGLSQCPGIRVIVDFHRYAVFRADFLGEWKISPAWKVRRIEHDPARRIKRPRGTDADTLDLSRGGQQRIDRADYGIESSLWRAICDHRRSFLSENLAGTVDNANRDLCSSDVDSQYTFGASRHGRSPVASGTPENPTLIVLIS